MNTASKNVLIKRGLIIDDDKTEVCFNVNLFLHLETMNLPNAFFCHIARHINFYRNVYVYGT
jgi:hypothetical protein